MSYPPVQQLPAGAAAENKPLSRTSFVAALFAFCSIFFVTALAYALTIFTEIEGKVPGANFGGGLACAGGVLAVGVPNADGNVLNTGGVTVFEPTQSLTGTPLAVPTGFPVTNGALFGKALTFIQDVNDNGRPELVVGAPNGFGGVGGVFIYPNFLGLPDRQYSGQQVIERFGSALGSITDYFLGAPLLLVGAPGRDNDIGAVDLFDLPDPVPTLSITPETPDGEFGTAIATIEDLESDNREEVLIGSPRHSSGGDNVGRVYLFSSAGLATLPTILNRIDGTVAGLNFGASLAVIPDVNGDSVQDLVVGAPERPGNTLPVSGRVYLFSGASLVSAPQLLCEIAGTTSSFGSSVSAAGDVNVDTLPDFAIGDPNGSGTRGVISVYSYQSGSCVLIDSDTGASVGYRLGVSLAGSGKFSCELTGDGRPEFSAGSESDVNGVNAGSVRIYDPTAPTPTPTATPTVTLTVTPPLTATPTVTPTIPLGSRPPSSRLTYRIARDGTFTLSTRFRSQPAADCVTRIYGRSVVNGRRGKVSRIVTITSPTQELRLSASHLPRVEKVNGAVPQMHLIASTTCGTKTVNSNVFARYLNCGRGDGRGIDSQDWIRILSSKLL